MAYPAEVMQATLEFSLSKGGAAQDIAEFSIWATADPWPTGDTDKQAFLEEMAQEVYEAWADAVTAGNWHTNLRLENVTTRIPNADGSTALRAAYSPVSKWAGSAAATQLPWQVATVISLYCYTPGGFVPQARSKRGRYYLPPPTTGWLNNLGEGTIADSMVSDLVDEQSTFLTVLSGDHTYDSGGVSITTALTLVVVSRQHTYATPVSFIRVDNRFDTQRRRANRETVVYQGASFPP